MTHDEVTGLILAGGQGRRMGGRDKGLEPFGSARLIEHARRCLDGRVAEVLINANRHLDEYRALGSRVVCDREGGYQGPLMGIWSGLEAAETPWVVVVPCDSPALPDDLVERLIAAIGEADIAVAHDGERDHPVVALIRRDLAEDLGDALREGERKIDRWYARHTWTRADFSDCPAAFANLNTEDDKARLAQQLRAGEA
ncbi:molybdenum cofactor guanylyltransferase MobA [Halomonas sp. I5-271120]|uniref:molybdenum cofactor guanylyltransferase MobA n=1 Tax=Halomonas sp. I5-271120 TaxID=3061632 RepID=UPI002714FD1A|nr:molybdenum cofactor guanylyltransferase MobA [Halomonas sp. I5-271120]